MGKFFYKIKNGNIREFYLFNKKIFSYEQNNSKKIKLGISYNLFDGEELLEASIKSVRKSAHYISVVYQIVSNCGETRNNDIEIKLADLKERGLIDEYVLYNTNLNLHASENERNKRQLGLKISKKAGCTHYLSMDTDEFYFEDEIERAKDFIVRKKIECSAVSIIEYLKDPTYQLVSNYIFSPANEHAHELSGQFTFYVPFICKINVPKRVKSKGYFPCVVDPTRKMNGLGKFFLFPKHEIAMHHMSTIRKDLEKKFRNSTITQDDDQKIVDYFYQVKKEILAFDFEKSSKTLENHAFIGNYLVKKVTNTFNIKV